MKALLFKELRPLLPQALVGAVLFAAVYAYAFDVEGALLAAPPDALPIVIVAALCLGALLGHGQLALERQADTLSYLLHRALTPDRVLLAKVLAGGLLLALVVHLPLDLFALWERWTSPLGPVLQWGRLAELHVAAVACVPAHALGLLCGSLRCSRGLRLSLLGLFVTGLGLAIAIFLDAPSAGPAASRWIYGAGLVLLAALVLWSLRGELLQVEDAERAPPLARILCLGSLALVLVCLPFSAFVWTMQEDAERVFSAGEPDLLWHPERGFVLATWDRDELERVLRPEGGEVDLSELLSGSMLTGNLAYHASYAAQALGGGQPDPSLVGAEVVPSSERLRFAQAGFRTVWSVDILPRVPTVWPYRSAPATWAKDPLLTPSIAPGWTALGSLDFLTSMNGGPLPGDDAELVVGGVRAYLDGGGGRVLVLYSPRASLSRWSSGMRTRRSVSRSTFEDTLVPQLRELVRGDGRPFSRRVLRISESLPEERPYGADQRTRAEGEFRLLDADGTGWSLDLNDPRSVFQLTEISLPVAVDEAVEDPPIRLEIEGDWLAYTLRVLDRASGELLVERHQGPFAGEGTPPSAYLLLASDLLSMPALLLFGHFTGEEPALEGPKDLAAGAFTSGGRRPLLLLCVAAVACALAWRAQHRLALRGAGRARRWGWTFVVALLGFQGWLLFMALEPRGPRAAAARPSLRQPLLTSERVALG